MFITVCPLLSGPPHSCVLARNTKRIDAKLESQWDRLLKVKLDLGGSVVFLADQCGFNGTRFFATRSAAPIRISLSAISVFRAKGLATDDELAGYRDGMVPSTAAAAEPVPTSDIELMFRAQLHATEFTPVYEWVNPTAKLFGGPKVLTGFAIRLASDSNVHVATAANGLPVLTPELRMLLRKELT
jgi:hypothetical protein